MFIGFRKGWPVQGCFRCNEEHEVADMEVAYARDRHRALPVLVCANCAQKLREKFSEAK